MKGAAEKGAGTITQSNLAETAFGGAIGLYNSPPPLRHFLRCLR
jgi:hypothetical protein